MMMEERTMVMRGEATVGTRTLMMTGRGTETTERGEDGRREKERDLMIIGELWESFVHVCVLYMCMCMWCPTDAVVIHNSFLDL